jgi:hypothetical protein
MAGKVKSALELAELIKEENSNGRDRIPNSETHMKNWCAHFAQTEQQIREVLLKLRDAHYIFIINIVSPDPNLYLPGTDSYVFADLGILNELKRFSENRLEKAYEATFYKKKSPFQITRELFPKIKEFNNTPLGKALNETVMLEEFSRVMQNSAFEYDDSWRLPKIKEIYEETLENITEAMEQEALPARAVDQVSQKKEALDNPNSLWAKLSSTFSVEFLLRIHFRKYEFEVVKKLIQTGKIRMEPDLKYIRDTLQMMEGRIDQDPILKRHLNEMIELRRLAQAKLNILRVNSRN